MVNEKYEYRNGYGYQNYSWLYDKQPDLPHESNLAYDIFWLLLFIGCLIYAILVL